jgi:hypothetical protein
MAITRQTSRRTLILQPSNAEVSTNQVYTPRYEFLVDGELSLPLPRVINSLKHQDAAANIYRVDVSVNKGGTSQYQVVITSYDQLGGDPIVHVDQFVTITTDRLRTTLPVLNAAVGENRSLECTITETNALIPATDMTVTVTMEDFSDIEIARNGHQIMDIDEVVQAQKDTLQFIGGRVSEDTLNQRTVVDVGVIGEVKHSMLTEAQMQTLYGNGWIIADGRSVAGSLYETITGFSTVPDMRGLFLRGKNNGRSDGNEDSAGERALGDLQQDSFEAHGHRVMNGIGGDATDPLTATNGFAGMNARTNYVDFDLVEDTGGAETQPRNIAVNIFIKVS